MRIRKRSRRRLKLQNLESRRLMVASVGWDGPGLGSADLTYTIGQAPPSVSQEDFETAVETALDAWAEFVDVTFTQVDRVGLPDSLDFTFANLDGPGGTLAQAYFPDDVNPRRIAGDVQFDASERWELGNQQGNRAFDLTWVAVHEVGHALGLDHLHESSSVLRPTTTANQQFVQLDPADIREIQELYAARQTSEPEDPNSNTPETLANVTDVPSTVPINPIDTPIENSPSTPTTPSEESDQDGSDGTPTDAPGEPSEDVLNPPSDQEQTDDQDSTDEPDEPEDRSDERDRTGRRRWRWIAFWRFQGRFRGQWRIFDFSIVRF